jgi:hypothetical protein
MALNRIQKFSVSAQTGTQNPWIMLDGLITEICGCGDIVIQHENKNLFPTSIPILEQARSVCFFSIADSNSLILQRKQSLLKVYRDMVWNPEVHAKQTDDTVELPLENSINAAEVGDFYDKLPDGTDRIRVLFHIIDV